MKLRNVRKIGDGKTMALYVAELTGPYEGCEVEFCVSVPHSPFTARARLVGSPAPSVVSEIHSVIDRYFEAERCSKRICENCGAMFDGVSEVLCPSCESSKVGEGTRSLKTPTHSPTKSHSD